MENPNGIQVFGSVKTLNAETSLESRTEAKNALKNLGDSIAGYFLPKEKSILLGSDGLTVSISFDNEGKADIKLSKDLPEVLALLNEKVQTVAVKGHVLEFVFENAEYEPLGKFLEDVFGGCVVIVISH